MWPLIILLNSAIVPFHIIFTKYFLVAEKIISFTYTQITTINFSESF